MKTALAIRHVPFEDLGSLAEPLAAADYAIQYLDAPVADFDAVARRPWDLMIVLGGPISSNDTGHFPFLTSEQRLIEARLKAESPVLGICLGSQLIARAMGAQVRRAEQTEIGWEPLSFTESGQHSPLRHFSSPVFHWHGETFEIPHGTTHLASTPRCRNQAFSAGRNTLAIQCHPEVTARGLEQWYVGNVGELQALGLSPAILREQAHRHAAQLAREAKLFLDEWLTGLLLGKSDPA